MVDESMPLLVGIAALAIYLSITPAVSGLGDGSEFTVGLATAGLVHPTGYPVYVLAGHLFVRLLHALGAGWPLAANAWSGVGAAVAVALSYAGARRLIANDGGGTGDPVATSRDGRAASFWALLPAGLLAFNPVLLGEAIEAEVNSWSLAWTLGIALFFVAALDRVRQDERPPSPLEVAAWGALCGLGLAHHLTSVLVAAPLTLALAAVFVRRRWLSAGRLGSAAAGAALPLLAYAFVFWRAAHPAPGQWMSIEPTAASVLDHVTGQRYRAFLGTFAPDPTSRRLLAAGIYPFLFGGLLLLGIEGARSTASERRLLWWGILAAALLGTLFTLNYGVPDPAPYFLPATGLALWGLAPLGAHLGGARRSLRDAALVAGLLALGVLAWKGMADAWERRDEAVRFDRQVRQLWARVPDGPGFLFWNADQVTRLVEYQVLRGERRQLWIASPEWLLDPPVRRYLERRAGIDPVEGVEIPYAPMWAPWSDSVRAEFFARVLGRLASRSPAPVYGFNPMIPVLEIVRKPDEPPGP